MDKKQFVIDYVDALMTQDIHDDKLRGAVDILAGGASDFDCVAYDYYRFIQDTVGVIIGHANVEWVSWFLYENRYSSPERLGGNVEIDDESFDITTVDQLFDICMDKGAFNEAFFQ